jgi:hypothetical protein
MTCSISCSITYSNDLKAKKDSKDWKARKKSLKEGLKTNQDYYQAALKVFNEYIRIRDKNKPCISCQAPPGTYKITSGHYYPQGTYRSVALNEMNAHGQCWFNCNKNKSGNLGEYRIALIEMYGIDKVEELDELRLIKKHYSIPELILEKEYWKQKIKNFSD